MKMKNPMLVVTDIDKSVEFYKKVLGLHVIMDFGANKTLTGGLALQSLESWQEFIGTGKHIIEIGENIKVVCKRFLDSGMTPEQIAERMDVPMKFVNACMR